MILEATVRHEVLRRPSVDPILQLLLRQFDHVDQIRVVRVQWHSTHSQFSGYTIVVIVHLWEVLLVKRLRFRW